jgi:hypothetical protein
MEQHVNARAGITILVWLHMQYATTPVRRALIHLDVPLVQQQTRGHLFTANVPVILTTLIMEPPFV